MNTKRNGRCVVFKAENPRFFLVACLSHSQTQAWRDLVLAFRSVSSDAKPICTSRAGSPPPFPTSTGGQGAAPLAIASTLGLRRPLQHIAGVAGEVHHVIQVELAAVGEPVGRVPRVPAGDGCRGRQLHVTTINQQVITSLMHMQVWRVWIPGCELMTHISHSIRRKFWDNPAG